MDFSKALQLLVGQGFTPFYYLPKNSSLSKVVPKSGKPGIYVLCFSNGEMYVGQSVMINKRFQQHKLKFSDVVAISYKGCSSQKLDEMEEYIVTILEKLGITLRNILLTSRTTMRGDLQIIMNEEEQREWISADAIEIKEIDPAIKQSSSHVYEKRFAELQKEENYNSLLQLLGKYISNSIPVPQKTEAVFWSISCYPGDIKTILCRVNIFTQEVFSVYMHKNRVSVSFHCTRSELKSKRFNCLDQKLYRFTNHKYKPGGHDQTNLFVFSLEDAIKLFEERQFLLSVRKFNMNLMLKGKCLFARSHCSKFAEAIYKHILN